MARYGVKERNARILAEARSRPCADCGLVEPEIIEFDHVPERGPKLFNVTSGWWTRSLRILTEEIAKTDPVCPNCHARRTNARRRKED